MKTIVALFLSGLVLLSSCGENSRKKVKNNDSTSVVKEAVMTTDNGLDYSVWRVRKYYFNNISAMDNKTASEWLNKILRIDGNLYFPFDEIPSYREAYKDQQACVIENGGSPEYIIAKEYFDPHHSPKELYQLNGKLRLYHTTCDGVFSEFIWTENDELIFSCDGVNFILTRLTEEEHTLYQEPPLLTEDGVAPSDFCDTLGAYFSKYRIKPDEYISSLNKDTGWYSIGKHKIEWRHTDTSTSVKIDGKNIPVNNGRFYGDTGSIETDFISYFLTDIALYTLAGREVIVFGMGVPCGGNCIGSYTMFYDLKNKTINFFYGEAMDCSSLYDF